jgi:hypothetical protein
LNLVRYTHCNQTGLLLHITWSDGIWGHLAKSSALNHGLCTTRGEGREKDKKSEENDSGWKEHEAAGSVFKMVLEGSLRTGPPSPMFEFSVAITMSQQASNTAFPAKQRPLTTPCENK